MDAKERLLRYLEQRRELGERELVLDRLSIDDLMRLLGAHRPHPTRSAVPAAAPEAPPAGGPRRAADAASGTDSPVPLRTPTREPGGAPRAASASAHPPLAATPADDERRGTLLTGLVVGTASRELFGGGLTDFATLEEIGAATASCRRCELYQTARQGVPGEGNPHAELVCVGEAPGATEDETGRPFVGQAGQLLEKILAAIDLRREDVFICNVLKHRPPGNRNPTPLEVTACSPYLLRQLELIRPKVILALGTFAAQTLLGTKTPIGKLRGAVHRYYGVPLIVTYHPAALLRNPAWKRPTWEDVRLARRILDSPRGS